jgi:hypothetical protein
MHSVFYNYCPKSFFNIFQKREDRNHDYNLLETNSYVVPIARIELFKKFPLYTFVQYWNTAGDIIFHQNPITFKKALTYELFSSLN